jgi:hypothetical protein
MRRFIPIFTATLLSIWTCAQAGEDKAQAGEDQAAEIAAAASKPTEAKGGDCVFSRTISNWESLDNETLIIWAPTRHDPYLVKLWMPAFNLKSEFSLGVLDADNDGQLCDYGRDAIVVRSPGGPERYKIRTLQRLDEAQAQAMIDSRKHKKETEPAATMPEQSDVKSDKQKPEGG